MRKYVVYMHTFQNGKKYIGITCVVPYTRRWRAGSGYYHQTKVYNAIKKYGWENIFHELLAKNLTAEEANDLEKQYIKQFDSINNGYNVSSGGGGTYGIPCSEEKKKKISVANKGKIPSTKTRNNLKNYTQEHGAWNKGKKLEGEHLKKITSERQERCNKHVQAINPKTQEIELEFDSCTLAANSLGICKQEISRCCSGKRKTSHGYIWRYVS